MVSLCHHVFGAGLLVFRECSFKDGLFVPWLLGKQSNFTLKFYYHVLFKWVGSKPNFCTQFFRGFHTPKPPGPPWRFLGRQDDFFCDGMIGKPSKYSIVKANIVSSTPKSPCLYFSLVRNCLNNGPSIAPLHLFSWPFATFLNSARRREET